MRVTTDRFVRTARARADVAALLAGVATTLGFAPFGLFPLGVLAPAVLFVAWDHATPRRAAWRGFLYGLGLFGVGVSWVYVSLHTYGNMPAPLAAFAVVLFVAGMALYPASLGALQARLRGAPAALRWTLAVPALWALLEWMRGWFLSGFPWLNLGYSQVDSPLAGYAPWAGVYGVTFAAAVSAGLIAAAWLDRPRALRAYLPMLLVVWVLGWFAGQVDWVRPAGEPLRVALVQANVPLASKWRPDSRQAIVDRYVQMSEQAPKVDLIVWPEAAVPGYLDELGPGLVPRLEQIAQTRGADFLFGVVERGTDARSYYNSVVTVGSGKSNYRKRHLVPFGEFLPWPGLFGWLIEHLQIPMSNFSAGAPGQSPLPAAGQRIGVSVCYEDAFGEEVIRMLPEATLLANVSEDAWFGDSLAPHQRLQMARLRALESGRAMLRAANTGPSAVIDHRGRVIARSPQFVAHTLVSDVQPMRGATPYAQRGNWPVVVVAGLLALGAFGWRWRAGAWSAKESL